MYVDQSPVSSGGPVVTLMYQNPIWSGYLADPFILRTLGGYYAYGTGPSPREADGRAFPVLRSDDLVHWKALGGALLGIKGASAYWAPEVAENGGRYYMYFSAALGEGDESHFLRVAVADNPAGPFKDTGRPLLPEGGFSIDPHPFRDPATGRWYLFFATDYTSNEPFGTGLAVVPMRDMLTITHRPTMVARANHPWQVYERNRNYKGRIWPAWYTLEGPCVLYHNHQYWCLYSGGRWSSDTYGVGFAVAEHPLGPWRDDYGVHGPVVLTSRDENALGPGHNSVVTAPDGRLLLVYHAWDRNRTARRMYIDPLRWTPSGPRCDGPSSTPQPVVEKPLE